MKFLVAVICSLKAPQQRSNVVKWLNEANQRLKLFLDWFIACWFSLSRETNKGGVSEILIIFGRRRAQNPNFTFPIPSKMNEHTMLYFFKTYETLPPPVCVRACVCVCVCVCINVYYGRKKTNKLQVHPYKPVSWLPTHRGILKMSGQPRNRLIGMNLYFICLFPPTIYTSLNFFVLSTVLYINIMRGKNDITTYPDKPVFSLHSSGVLNPWRVKRFTKQAM